MTREQAEFIATALIALAILGGWCAWAWLYALQGWAELTEAQRQRARAFWAAMRRATQKSK